MDAMLGRGNRAWRSLLCSWSCLGSIQYGQRGSKRRCKASGARRAVRLRAEAEALGGLLVCSMAVDDAHRGNEGKGNSRRVSTSGCVLESLMAEDETACWRAEWLVGVKSEIERHVVWPWHRRSIVSLPLAVGESRLIRDTPESRYFAPC